MHLCSTDSHEPLENKSKGTRIQSVSAERYIRQIMRCERDSSPKNEKSVITDLPKCHFKTCVTLFLSRMQKEMFNRMFMLVYERICIRVQNDCIYEHSTISSFPIGPWDVCVLHQRERERERERERNETMQYACFILNQNDTLCSNLIFTCVQTL